MESFICSLSIRRSTQELIHPRFNRQNTPSLPQLEPFLSLSLVKTLRFSPSRDDDENPFACQPVWMDRSPDPRVPLALPHLYLVFLEDEDESEWFPVFDFWASRLLPSINPLQVTILSSSKSVYSVNLGSSTSGWSLLESLTLSGVTLCYHKGFALNRMARSWTSLQQFTFDISGMDMSTAEKSLDYLFWELPFPGGSKVTVVSRKEEGGETPKKVFKQILEKREREDEDEGTELRAQVNFVLKG